MRVSLSRCTCTRIHVSVVEVAKFDMRLKELVFLAKPSSAKYGTGYVRECGSCVEYCQQWPGQSKQYVVSTQALSCKEVMAP